MRHTILSVASYAIHAAAVRLSGTGARVQFLCPPSVVFVRVKDNTFDSLGHLGIVIILRRLDVPYGTRRRRGLRKSEIRAIVRAELFFQIRHNLSGVCDSGQIIRLNNCDFIHG